MAHPFRIVFCALVFTGLTWLAVGQSPPANPRQKPISEWVEELGDPSFAKRERASEAVWRFGEEARPALEQALRSGQDEVVARARDILERFDAGQLPDITPELKTLIDQFRTGQISERLDACRKLCHVGDAGPPTLARLITKQYRNPDDVNLFLGLLHEVLEQEVPILILNGQLSRAEALLELMTCHPQSPGLMSYAFFVAETRRAPAAVERLKSRSIQPGTNGLAARRTLVLLYRAMGEVSKALEQAKSLEPLDPSFAPIHDSLLEDAGKWPELAKRLSRGNVNSREGLQIFHLRMAGQTVEANKLIEEQKDADPEERGRVGLVDSSTLALMLNNRPLDGIDRLKTQHNSPHILADVLASRLQFKEALDLVTLNERGDDASALNRGVLRQLYGTRRGRLLWQLGQRDAADQVFNKLANEITGGPENRDGRPYPEVAITQLVRTEVRSGRYDLACEHLATALAMAGYDGGRPRYYGQDPFELLFDLDADVAECWWRILRKQAPPSESAGATMRKVRRLLTGQSPKPEREAALKVAEAFTGPVRKMRSRDGRQDEPDADLVELDILKPMAMATMHRAGGETAAAIQVLSQKAEQTRPASEIAPDDPEGLLGRYGREFKTSRGWIFGIDEAFRFWVELGDLLLEQGQPREAARRYFQGWRQEPANGLLLYLSGKALVKAGDEPEGRRRMESAHLVCLGNPRMRGRFLEELITRGYAADVKREIQAIRQCGWISELYVGNVWNQVARGANMLKDFQTAAIAHNRAIYYLLRTPGVSYVEGYAYLTVPQAVRVATARHLVQSGKVAEGIELAKECLTVMPGNNELVIGLVPVLDQAGQAAQADGLFRIVWDAYNDLIRQYPDSAWARSQAAWCAAGCRRELPRALELAKKAVELEPNVRSFRETLAEVSFRNKDRAAAIAIMKQLIQEDRRSHHYKRQLERYQTAAFDVVLPETEDD